MDGRRHRRFDGTHLESEVLREFRAAVRGGQPSRRGRADRHRAGCQSRTRRPHTVARHYRTQFSCGSLYAKLPFDPVKDFASVSLMATTCYVLSVHPSMPVSNARQLVALAKARPGQLTLSSPGSGTPNHLSGEMLKMLTGIDMQHVPFKGSAQAISNVIGGQIATSFANLVVARPFVKN